ncbi:MAG: ArnT family glycosyltransferase [Myxococcota bacterium]
MKMLRPETVAALVLALMASLVLLWDLPETPLTDDDDFYLPAGERYAEWLMGAFRGEGWSRHAVDAAFELNHEHPPVAKYGLGLAGQVFSFLGPVAGPRVFTVACAVLLVVTMLLLSTVHLGSRRGILVGSVAALCLLCFPRFAFHSRVATLDVPVAAAIFGAAGLALYGERSRLAAWLSGPAFGLAAATKLNGPFLIIPMVVFWWLTRRRTALEGEPIGAEQPVLRLPAVPETALSMAILGPLTFWLLWPWLWFDTWDRVSDYVAFHLNHYPIFMLYFGRIYGSEFAPWHAPLVMTVFTSSMVTLCLGLWGAGAAAVAAVYRVRRRNELEDPSRAEGDYGLFLVLNAVVAIGVVMFSGGPKYGGVKLFLPFFPFWCCLAGYGALRMAELYEPVRRRRMAMALIGLGLLGPVAYGRSFTQHGLSAYGPIAGGLRGATGWGMERQYYDLLTNEHTSWLNANAPKQARVHFLPNHKEYVRTFRWAHRQGSLRKDIRVVSRPERAHLIVLTHERRWKQYDEHLASFRGREPLYTRSLDGVPLWSVFKNR